MTAWSYKIFKTTFLIFSLLDVNSHSQTFTSISQNFCLNLAGEEDNLSCGDAPVEAGICFDRDQLCDGFVDCLDDSDEGADVPSLRCEWGGGEGIEQKNYHYM